MRIAGVSGIVAAVVLAGAAQAQEASVFDGPYAGAQVGWGFYDIEASLTGFGSGEEDIDGVEGGLYGGYGLSSGPLFGAVEVEGNLVGAQESFGGGNEIEGNYSFGIGARIGGVVMENTLLYGRLGYQFLNAEASGPGYSEDEDFHGLRLGGGAEYAFTENVHGRLEYSYTFYDKKTYTDGFSTATLEPSQHLVRMGISYQF